MASSSSVGRHGACGVYHRTLELAKVRGVELDARDGHDDGVQDGFLGGPACVNVRRGDRGVDGGDFGFDYGD